MGISHEECHREGSRHSDVPRPLWTGTGHWKGEGVGGGWQRHPTSSSHLTVQALAEEGGMAAPSPSLAYP